MRMFCLVVLGLSLVTVAPARGGEALPGRDRPKPRSEDVPAVQRYCVAELKRAETFPPGSDERKRLLRPLIVYMDAQCAFNEDRDLDGLVLWFRYVLGRARALGGDMDGACHELDVVIGFDAEAVLGDAREYVDELRLNAYHLKVKTAFRAGDYEACVGAADNMLAPVTGYPGALSDNRGNAAAIYRAKSLSLKKHPDFARAVEQCMRVIDSDHGGWPNNAREVLYEVHSATSGSLPPRVVTPAFLRGAARGAYLRALSSDVEDKRRGLLDEAVALFQDAVVACRGDHVALATRLDHEPRALLEMGVVYSSHELWYESMFCFEEVIFRFSRERVGRLLASDQRFGRDWRAHREAARAVAAVGLHRGFYWKMSEGSPLSKVLQRHEQRLTMCARNLRTAARKRWQESGSGFDEGLVRRATGILARLNAGHVRRPPEKAGEDPGEVPTDEDEMVF